MQGIYKIRNRVNGKYYVGSSNDIEKRWQEHRWALKKGKHFNNHLQNTWNKYGRESFEFKLVEEVENKEDLHLIEQEYLDEGFEKCVLYNMAREASGGREPGWHHTEESKARMRRNQPDQSGKNNPMYGRHHTEETKAKIRENRSCLSGKNHPMYGVTGEDNPLWGKPRSEECKQKLRRSWTPERKKEKSEQMSGENNPFYGRRHTEETIAKIEESWTPERRKKQSERKSGENNPMYGNRHTEESRRKSSESHIEYYKTHDHAMKGKKHSEHSRRMIAENNPKSFLGRHHTEEAKAKMAEKHTLPYPAFQNVKTREFLPPGRNLKGLCQEQNLNYQSMCHLKSGNTKQSRDGWSLA